MTTQYEINSRDEMMTEDDTHKFCAFASDLELAPGDWPTAIETNRGNGNPFYLVHVMRNAETEVMWCTYRQVAGCITLRVFND